MPAASNKIIPTVGNSTGTGCTLVPVQNVVQYSAVREGGRERRAGSAYWSSRSLRCAFFFTPNNYWRCHGNCSHSLAIGTTLRCLSASVSILSLSSPTLLSLFYYSRNMTSSCYRRLNQTFIVYLV